MTGGQTVDVLDLGETARVTARPDFLGSVTGARDMPLTAGCITPGPGRQGPAINIPSLVTALHFKAWTRVLAGPSGSVSSGPSLATGLPGLHTTITD